jgi:threonine/homoserine/homoserine lactone efflux protein
MTRNFVPCSWGVGFGIAVCFGLWLLAFFVGLAGYARFIPEYTAYLWPGSLLFLVPSLEHHPLAFWTVVAASVAANALLYGCLFVLARLLTRWLRKRALKRLTNR